MNFKLKLISNLFLMVVLLCVSCSRKIKTKENLSNGKIELQTIIDKEQSSNDSIIIYEIQMDTLLSKRKYLRLHMYKTQKMFNGQDLIGYGYCDSKLECDTTSFEPIIDGGNIQYQNEEITGQIRDEHSQWMHPPRSEYFKILEMNAFPYFFKDKKEWEYELSIGDYWGDERWVTWEGRKTSVSKYKLTDTIFYNFGNEKIKCAVVKAFTKIDSLGETETTYYYNSKFGFVYMLFRTINDEMIEFKMI